MRGWASLLVAAGACAGEHRLTLPAPAAGVQTVLLGYQDGAQLELEVRAHQPGAPLLIRRSAPLEALFAAYFAESLTDLGLAEGPVRLAAPDECRPRPFPPARQAFRWSAETEQVEALLAGTSPVAGLSYAAACPCKDLVEVARVPIPRRVLALVPRGEEVLVVSPDGVRRLALPATLAAVEPLPGAPLTAAFGAAGGPLYLGTSDGRLLRGSLEAGFSETGTTASYAERMDGARGGAPEELFSVHQDGEIRRLAAGRWHTILAERSGETGQAASVAWIGPGRMVALQLDGIGPVHFDAALGPATRTELWDVLLGPPSAVGAVDGQGVFLATRLFTLHRFQSVGSWPRLPQPSFGAIGTLFAFAGYEDSLIFAGNNTRVGQFHSEVGYCSDRNLQDGPEVRHAVVTAGYVVLGGERQPGNSLVVLQPRPRP